MIPIVIFNPRSKPGFIIDTIILSLVSLLIFGNGIKTVADTFNNIPDYVNIEDLEGGIEKFRYYLIDMKVLDTFDVTDEKGKTERIILGAYTNRMNEVIFCPVAADKKSALSVAVDAAQTDGALPSGGLVFHGYFFSYEMPSEVSADFYSAGGEYVSETGDYKEHYNSSYSLRCIGSVTEDYAKTVRRDHSSNYMFGAIFIAVGLLLGFLTFLLMRRINPF